MMSSELQKQVSIKINFLNKFESPKLEHPVDIKGYNTKLGQHLAAPADDSMWLLLYFRLSW